MRTITTICAFVALSLTISLSAQQTRSISQLMDVLKQNHKGSITDVFSTAEIALLRDHFNTANYTDASRVMGDLGIHTTENTLANFAKIDKMDLSTITIIAPSPLNEFEGAGATVPMTNGSTVVDNDNNFYHVNANGTYTAIGPIMPDAGQSFTGLEYTSDGNLYGIATNGSGSTRLYQINLTNQTATPVGTDNGLVVGIALGRDMNNNLFSYDIDTNLVYRIDRLTGTPTLLGDIGFDANFGQGMGYHPGDDKLYISAFNNTSFKPELRTVDTNTGASTLVGTIVPAQTYQFAWMSLFDTLLGTDNPANIEFQISPNPVRDILTVSSEMNIETVAIYSVLGQLIQQSRTDSSRVTIDVSALNSGVYIITLVNGERSTTKKFIKL